MDIKKKRNVLIELNGLPGCGKTTIVNELEKIMEEEGIPYFNLNDVYFYKEKNEISKILTIILAILSIRQIPLNIKILKYLLSFNLNKERFLYTLRLIKLLFQIRRVKDKESCKAILLEEGILQYTASISHVDFINNQKLLGDIVGYMLDYVGLVICVNCNLEYNDIVRRIKNRNNLERRFDSMNDELLIEGLKANQSCFNIMRSSNHEHSFTIDVNTINSPKENSKEIYGIYKIVTNKADKGDV